MSEFQLSVIIPVYNVEQYLEQCLDSVLNQSYKNFEIICVDDCSEDNSLKILQKYAEKYEQIKILQNEKNIGLGLTRNRGLEIAKGEYIHFLDSDDWLEDSAYEKLIEKLENLEQKPEMLFFLHRKYDNRYKNFEEINYKNNEIIDKILSPQKDIQAFDNWDRFAWCKWFLKDFLVNNGIKFNDYKCMEDVEHAALAYTKAKSIVYTDIKVVNYRVHRENSLFSQSSKNIGCIYTSFLNNKKIYEKLSISLKNRMLGADYFLLKKGLIDAYNKKHINIFELFHMIYKINKGGDYKNYIFEMPENLKSYPLAISFWKIVLKDFSPNLFNFFVKLKKIFNIS